MQSEGRTVPHHFDIRIERRGTNSLKWDYNKRMMGEEDVLPMWVADMDFACPPAVTEALVRRAQHPVYGYPGRPAELYEAVADWFARRFGVTVDTGWLGTVPGVVPGMHIAVEAFTEPGDSVLIQTPVYHSFFYAVESLGRRIVQNPLREENGRYVMDWDGLRQVLDENRPKLFLLCSPHNPVGRVWTREELVRLGQMCAERDIVVVSDEIHADLVYEKGRHVPYFSLPEPLASQSLTLVSATKTFNLAGLTSAFVISPAPRLLQAFRQAARRMGHPFLNLFGIEATIAAYRHGEPWLDELLVYLKGNAEYIRDFLAERIPEVSMAVPEATYLGWMDFRRLGLSQNELNALVRKRAKLGLHDGTVFGKEGAGFQRINFACPRVVLEEAMSRLEMALHE
jgi:cysteine-S-conjugate beta-lyase